VSVSESMRLKSRQEEERMQAKLKRKATNSYKHKKHFPLGYGYIAKVEEWILGKWNELGDNNNDTNKSGAKGTKGTPAAEKGGPSGKKASSSAGRATEGRTAATDVNESAKGKDKRQEPRVSCSNP
jgi:hypothetical protein